MTTKTSHADRDSSSKSNEGGDMAKMLLTPGVASARAIRALEGRRLPASIDIVDLKEALERQVAAMRDRGSDQQEAMLLDQAVTLQQMFVRLIERAEQQTLADHHSKLLQLALRAQNQSRTTLQALAELRTPRSHVFARQANVAQNQQINHMESPATPDSDKTQMTQNELLEEHSSEQRLDTRTTSSTGTGDPAMETVGAFQRPKDA
ncbi:MULTISPECIES: hypothetical protein [unclassified Thioalkalivibrio]|uniref:hypothetical protein n=1 Tax=unclassified Thioalkalivibrio TaxID=2621013 RepID=UPI00035D9716|nr:MULTISPECIES: hypothetical protein [unclassified Thioalkalivibrio]